MFSVVIPTHNNEATLVETLAALVPATAEGVVREVIVADAGSSDLTEEIADAAGCRWVRETGAYGARLAAGVQAASRGEWLLFLEPDTVLDPDWFWEVSKFVERAEWLGRGDTQAACFRAAGDELGLKARLGEGMAWICARILGIGREQQGLLLSRRFYAKLGGHKTTSVLAHADLVRRIGRRRMTHLPVCAVRRTVPDADGLFLASPVHGAVSPTVPRRGDRPSGRAVDALSAIESGRKGVPPPAAANPEMIIPYRL
ncbi:glycosyltransferase [Breoghania sp.]|uniref:glycosyltransferase n=1 Tax=Breoghania sp. TaxID=2065378 RepID=UPI0026172746|nr:glycosyltransferase [Breoghania sp.]MDJ0930305.1 glycosyltransferase [Breoghania sp.]